MLSITVTTKVNLDIETAAEWFAGLDDDQMCKFFVKIAQEVQETYPTSSAANNQWYYLGGHLRSCECSTEAAREMIKAWAHWIDHSKHKRSKGVGRGGSLHSLPAKSDSSR